jgi:hypothetical protein
MSNILGLAFGALWLQRSREAIGKEDDERIWIEYYLLLF